MEISKNGVDVLRKIEEETVLSIVLKISKVEKLPHLPNLKRKLNVSLCDNNETI